MALEREVIWVGSSKKDLIEFPDDVKDEMGYGLHLAQQGSKHPNAKPFKIRDETGVFEIVSDFNTDTYRAVYAINIDERLYVLHSFKKKSKKGSKTPQPDVDLIKRRLLKAKEYAEKNPS